LYNVQGWQEMNDVLIFNGLLMLAISGLVLVIVVCVFSVVTTIKRNYHHDEWLQKIKAIERK